ncbi:NHS-like protein 2 isoform X2 [Pantherophis guttatus]|uniref:NHS-like protein 2 isoform X2 n=1 Tax=Pantherophis guttatus TaxID=94885 RepID=A0ABM3ZI95_PANGU|nr:NHS-like protein 2 isoform X2 [Pantherophis guttatus]
MPFWKRTVEPRRLLPSPAAAPHLAGLPLAQLHEVCGLTTLALLRQLADLCGHSAALLGELEGRLLELSRRAHRLRGRLRRVRGLLRPGASSEPATSNLDLDVKKPTPPKLLWHQPVNIFLARPVGVEDLHHEAELNLQSLLQEYEEPYSDAKISGQTFRYASSPSVDRHLECSPHPAPNKRMEFIYMPASQQVKEHETTSLGVRVLEPSLSLPATPDKHTVWTQGSPLPALEEKRLQQPCSTQANIVPINVSGQPFARHASARHSLFNTETAMNPKSLLRRRRTVIGFPHLSLRDPGSSNGPILNPPATIAESISCNFVPDVVNGRSSTRQARSPHSRPQLRKTFSDLGGVLQGRGCQIQAGRAENSKVMYASPLCNGPKEDSVFSPGCGTSSFCYTNSSVSQNEVAAESASQMSPCTPRDTPEADQPSSFFISQDNMAGTNECGTFCASPESPLEAEGSLRCGRRDLKVPTALVHSSEEESSQLERERIMCRFRERSLSVPTDTASLCSVDIGGSETCGLSYPSASSEGSTSTDNISLAVDQEARKQRRQRTKSISLKKAKKKPCPPTRSVSLIKEGEAEESGEVLSQDQRPKSLYLLPDAQVHNKIQGDPARELESRSYVQQGFVPEWNSGDPYCSLSGSSTATGTTVIELSKVRGSSESLPSPSVSRATTPSHLCADMSLKTSSPGRLTGVMSPSSGYSSQSETPTPTVPTSMVLGHVPHQSGRPRPLVPERKSSLPPVSPMERSPRSRLSFDLPFAPPTHLDLSGLKISHKSKAKVSRHHSESTFGAKLGPKLSPVQPVMPMVTQLDLRSVRLRSISRSETEDNLDSPELLEEPGKKIRPPVAEKPPLSRRPPMLLHKTPPVQEESPVSSPTSPATPQELVPAENIYMMARRPDHLWDASTWSPTQSPSAEGAASPTQGTPGTFFSASRRLSEDSLEEDEQTKAKVFDEALFGGESRKTKVPPPVPKKPSVLYLPLVTSPLHPGPCPGDQRLPPSPVIMLDEDSAYSELTTYKVPSPVANEVNVSPIPADLSWGDIPGNSVGLRTKEKRFVNDKTAESITEEDDDVFVTTRTTEDLFTVIHRPTMDKSKKRKVSEENRTFNSTTYASFVAAQERVRSKRKLLGWKEPSDSFTNRPNSQMPTKNIAGLVIHECPSSTSRTSSKNEDFKALLQKKGGKGASGIRTSAAELLKTTNPLARRVMTEFAVDGTIPSSKIQP